MNLKFFIILSLIKTIELNRILHECKIDVEECKCTSLQGKTEIYCYQEASNYKYNLTSMIIFLEEFIQDSASLVTIELLNN